MTPVSLSKIKWFNKKSFEYSSKDWVGEVNNQLEESVPRCKVQSAEGPVTEGPPAGRGVPEGGQRWAGKLRPIRPSPWPVWTLKAVPGEREPGPQRADTAFSAHLEMPEIPPPVFKPLLGGLVSLETRRWADENGFTAASWPWKIVWGEKLHLERPNSFLWFFSWCMGVELTNKIVYIYGIQSDVLCVYVVK